MAHNQDTPGAGVRTVTVDIVTATLIFVIGALVLWESHRLGSSWAADGPESGYFPFYIGILICICGAVVLVQGLLKLGTDRSVFVSGAQFRQVLVILLPSLAYVLGIQYIGIYVPSAIFIGLFMRIAGNYSWLRSVLVGGGVAGISFVLFEIWFKIPLPKGPVEAWFGF